MGLTATIEQGELVIRLPLENPPTPSKKGKTMIIASSRGNVTAGLVIDGKPVILGVNAYVKR